MAWTQAVADALKEDESGHVTAKKRTTMPQTNRNLWRPVASNPGERVAHPYATNPATNAKSHKTWRCQSKG